MATDCEGARDAVELAVSAPMGKLLTHKNRVLLLEWRGRMREALEKGVQVSIGWMKGHADRVDWPWAGAGVVQRVRGGGQQRGR